MNTTAIAVSGLAVLVLVSLLFIVSEDLHEVRAQRDLLLSKAEETIALLEQVKTERDDSIALTDRAVVQATEAFELSRDCMKTLEELSP